MPDAPTFVVRAFEANYTAAGAVERILALTVGCGQCGTTSSCGGSQLIHLPGGALFRCESCGSHQAISHARLDASSVPIAPRAAYTPMHNRAPVVTLRS